MGKQTSISNGQILLLLITLVASTAVLFVPSITSQHAKQDAWISILVLATLYGLAVVWVCASLALRFPGKSFGQYLTKLVGKPLGILISLAYLGFLLHSTMVIIREFGEFLNTAFMPETPIEIFNLTLILLAAYAVYHGIEVICRVNLWIFPMLLGSFLFIIFLVLPEANLSHLFPVMANGFYPVLRGSFATAAFRGEVFLLLFLIPHAAQMKRIKPYGAAAVIFLAIFLAADTAVTTMVFGSQLSANLTFSTFSLARYVSVAVILERVEALVMIIWVAGVIVKVSIFYYAAVTCLEDCLKIKKKLWVLLSTSVILYFGSLYAFENAIALSSFINAYFPFLASAFEFIIPLILLIIAKARKLGGKSSA